MSRIGKKPIALPDGVKLNVAGRVVTVESGKNKLTFEFRPEINVALDAATKSVVVTRKNDDRFSKALHGTTRARIANMITGVTAGFSKELEVIGVGWTAKLTGATLALSVGYADIRNVTVPAGVKVEVNQNKIKVSGADRQAVGQVAAVIRSQRPPEPYNGKGIKYSDERIIRKAGKAFAGGGA
jgi:large subunit ribosomal protein L6